MEECNNYDILCDSISSMRKQKGMTQEQIASQLGISPQAVSKWESKRSCPDIGLLPQIARMFDTTIDGLFGIQPEAPQPQTEPLAPIGIVQGLPWPEDGALHVVVYRGHRLLRHFSGSERQNMVFRYDGPALNVNCDLDLICERDVAGKWMREKILRSTGISCMAVQTRGKMLSSTETLPKAMWMRERIVKSAEMSAAE